jgi:hypothetical protein
VLKIRLGTDGTKFSEPLQFSRRDYEFRQAALNADQNRLAHVDGLGVNVLYAEGARGQLTVESA